MHTWSEAFRNKFISPETLQARIEALRSTGKTIATINGSFDLLHAGHLHILYEGSQTADIFVVALNSDKSIQTYKSPERPLISLEYRLQMMAALGFVDFVTWFDETDPRHVLSLIKPDVHVNGAEYGDQCIEAQTVKENGGKLHIVPLIPGLSTSQIIAKIQSLHQVDLSCAS
jgi:D-beta-D-heptose 7-phosphate kinase/D-beta-D-heptose 1-phosphate adenosyltransferase